MRTWNFKELFRLLLLEYSENLTAFQQENGILQLDFLGIPTVNIYIWNKML